MKASRQEVFEAINGERTYQEERWFGQFHTPTEWLVYIEDYLNEAKRLVSRNNGDLLVETKVMAIMRKIAAMSVCAMEQNGAPRR